MWSRVFLAFGATLLGACNSAEPESAFLDACRDVLQKRLISPSSYAEIGHSEPRIAPLTYDWWLNDGRRLAFYDRNNLTDAEINLRDRLIAIGQRLAQSGEHLVATTAIRFESSNALGVMIADIAVCEARFSGPEVPTDIEEFDEVMIDGLTHMDWVIASIGR